MAEKKIDLLRKADFVAISIDSLDEAKHDYLKNVDGAWKEGTQAVKALHKEGIKVSVTPTISQRNLDEIIDLTNHYTTKGIPVWYCLYSYDTSIDRKQLFRIGKENDDLVITDRQAIVNLCNQLIEMKKKNKKILMTDKLLLAMLQAATTTILPDQSLIYRQNGKAQNSKSYESPIMNVLNVTISATCSIHYMEVPTVTYR